jgi:hypothetical protein
MPMRPQTQPLANVTGTQQLWVGYLGCRQQTSHRHQLEILVSG